VMEVVSRGRVALVALATAQEAAVVEHVLGVGVEGPVVALAGVARLPGDLDEAVVETQIVADRVLPRGELVPVVGEAGHDEVADAAQGESLVRTLEDAHGDERDVRVGRLHGPLGPLLGTVRRRRRRQLLLVRLDVDVRVRVREAVGPRGRQAATQSPLAGAHLSLSFSLSCFGGAHQRHIDSAAAWLSSRAPDSAPPRGESALGGGAAHVSSANCSSSSVLFLTSLMFYCSDVNNFASTAEIYFGSYRTKQIF